MVLFELNNSLSGCLFYGTNLYSNITYMTLIKNNFKLNFICNYLIVLLLPSAILLWFLSFTAPLEFLLDLEIHFIFNFFALWHLNIFQIIDLSYINKLDIFSLAIIHLIIRWTLVFMYTYILRNKHQYISYGISVVFGCMIFWVGYLFFMMLMSV